MLSIPSLGAGLLLAATSARAIQLDLNDTDSVKSASRTVVDHIISIYNDSSNATSGFIPGLFPQPYYFWEAGLAWDVLIEYWALTGDATYNSLVQEALLFQTGSDYNYLPANQTKNEGNDDQSQWALAVLNAAERNFPPAADQQVSWLQLAENVFNSQVLRWDTSTCGGGLRWQIFAFNSGYDYKNSVSNGNLFEVAARLARFTGNATYLSWAQTVSDWSLDSGLVDRDTWAVWDGFDTTTNCSALDHIRFTENYARYIGGAAYSYNQTRSGNWSTLADSLINSAAEVFTTATYDNVIEETACAPENTCNTDQLAFRATLLRALAAARALVPSTSNRTSSLLSASALAAAEQCSGGASGTVCGNSWGTTDWDGTSGLGQDLSALAAFLANLPAVPLRTAADANATVPATPSGTGTSTLPQNGGAVNATSPSTSPSPSTSAAPSKGAGARRWGEGGMVAAMAIAALISVGSGVFLGL